MRALPAAAAAAAAAAADDDDDDVASFCSRGRLRPSFKQAC